jgi:hypothetical protein
VANRITRLFEEVVGEAAPKARISRIFEEVVGEGAPTSRVSRIFREVLADPINVPVPPRTYRPRVFDDEEAAPARIMTMMARIDTGAASSPGTPVQLPVMIILL